MLLAAQPPTTACVAPGWGAGSPMRPADCRKEGKAARLQSLGGLHLAKRGRRRHGVTAAKRIPDGSDPRRPSCRSVQISGHSVALGARARVARRRTAMAHQPPAVQRRSHLPATSSHFPKGRIACWRSPRADEGPTRTLIWRRALFADGFFGFRQPAGNSKLDAVWDRKCGEFRACSMLDTALPQPALSP